MDPTLNGQSSRPASSKARCPRCGSRSLELVETMEAMTFWEVTEGRLDFNEGIHEPGYIQEVQANCRGCKHHWRLRNAATIRSVITVDDEDTPS